MEQTSSIAEQRLARARQSLEGLSCGDAFGERFLMNPELARMLIDQRLVASAPWRYTDDTIMALAIVEVLEEHGQIHQERLAYAFGRNFIEDRSRGYGLAMLRFLPRLEQNPASWKAESQALFNGRGSFGNGSAMRVAPLGAYFADDLDLLVDQAEFSAVITHSHPEATGGAVAIAAAAALAWQHRTSPLAPLEFLQKVCDLTPLSEVQLGIVRAMTLPPTTPIQTAAAALGNGSSVTAQDTVPFCLWAAAHHLDKYEDALWTTVAGLGDCDTTCAIVGGIVAMSAGIESIPAAWRESREPLPEWPE